MPSHNADPIDLHLLTALDVRQKDGGAAAELALDIARRVRHGGLDHEHVVSICERLAVIDFELALQLRDQLFPWEQGQPLWPDPDA